MTFSRFLVCKASVVRWLDSSTCTDILTLSGFSVDVDARVSFSTTHLAIGTHDTEYGFLEALKTRVGYQFWPGSAAGGLFQTLYKSASVVDNQSHQLAHDHR